MAAATILGSGLAITWSALAGVAITVIILVATGLYLFSTVDPETPTDDGVAIDTLRAQRENIESELESVRDSHETKKTKLEKAEVDFDAVRSEYDIPENADPSTVREFYTELVDLHEEIVSYDAERERYRADKSEVESILGNVRETLAEVGAVGDGDASLEDADHLFAIVEQTIEHCENTQKVDKSTEAVRDIEADIADILFKWEAADNYQPGDDGLPAAFDRFLSHGKRVEAARERRDDRSQLRRELRKSLSRQSIATAFEPYRNNDDGTDDDAWVIATFEEVLLEYGDIGTVEDRHEAIKDEIKDFNNELDTKRDERADLKQELESLASDDDIRAAHETIEIGQRKLEPLLEQYATNRIGEYLLDELHERFIDRTTGPLLEEASQIFERITGGEYTTLNSCNEFDDLDFEAILADGTRQQTTELSRATAEQLFLAIRLARIKRHDEPLPVLLDDSLTNFDPEHIDRTLDVVSELADETQVFVLTCHPSLLEDIEANRDATYWCLNDGQFTGPHGTADSTRELLARGTVSSPTAESQTD